MSERKPISKKVRFEVFKRDGFKCQYCGASAPDVILHLDHIKPVVDGGSDDSLNLVTACEPCNLGKGPRLLSDRSVIEKQRQQLEDLQERREQLEMMLQWREELLSFEDEKTQKAVDAFNEAACCQVTESGRKKLARIVKTFPFDVVLDAITASTEQYLRADPEGGYTDESRAKAFDYIGRICHVQVKDKDRPYLKDLFYIRGIVRKRMNWIDDQKCLKLLEQAYLLGASIEGLRGLALEAKNWRSFSYALEAFITEESS